MTIRLRPRIGLGTMRYGTPEECIGSVESALEMGYRHVDSAQKYGNEREVGEGIARSSVSREDITLATKVHEDNLAYDDVLRTVDESLERLGVEYVDLLYVHWPAHAYNPETTLVAFNELVEAGKTDHVGLANVTPDLLDEAYAVLNEPPIAIQVEMHPLLQQDELLAYAQDHDMYLVAYCPLLRGEIFDVPELHKIGDDTGMSVVQLSLTWLCSKDHVHPIPKATGEIHLRENLEAAGIDLADDTIARIDAIDREKRVVDPPEKGPWNWSPSQ